MSVERPLGRARAIDGLLWVAACLSVAVTVVWSLGPAPPEGDAFPHADKVLHALAYAVTVLLVLLAAAWRPGRGAGPFPGSVAWIVLGAAAAGGMLELLQHVTGRDTELLDWVADVVGVAVAVSVWAWLRRRSASPPP